ncbi:MAG TPA: hypothetical protein VIJ16_00120 [Gemmatimonadaceae bacterium]
MFRSSAVLLLALGIIAAIALAAFLMDVPVVAIAIGAAVACSVVVAMARRVRKSPQPDRAAP